MQRKPFVFRVPPALPVAAMLGFGLLAGNAQAGARDDLAAFTKGLKGLDGQFTQQVYDASGKRKENASGRFALSAPRLFRWEYTKPYPQLIVADGKHVWVYEPDLQQATKRAQGAEEQNSPLTALIDPSKLERNYTVTEAGTEAGLEWLQLTPRNAEEGGFRSFKAFVIPAQCGKKCRDIRRLNAAFFAYQVS